MKNNEYFSAFEYFIDKMLEMHDTINNDITEPLGRLCSILRIGRINIDLYDNYRSTDPKKTSTATLYSDPPYNTSRNIVRTNVTDGDNAAQYTAMQKEGGEEWDEVEIARINRMLDLLFLFNGRTKLSRYAEKLIFFDHEMDIRNLKFYLRYVAQLCARRLIGQYAAIFANLRKFSVINEQIGRENGTKVMQGFVNTIGLAMSNDELIARVGGDNFVFIVKKDNLQNILDKLAGVPIPYGDGEKVMIKATAGVYSVPDNESITSPTDIMDRISLASHIARASGTAEPVFFNEEIMKKSKHIISITAEFPAAIQNKEFKVYYQPKVSLDRYSIAGAEALCRWFHNGKMMPPNDFIPVLERGMEICKLDFYMLGEVCQHIRGWLDSGMKPVRISVNLSRRHLSDINLANHIISTIDSYNVPHEYIEIELTETTTDIELQNLKRIINELQNAGVAVSVDDFGIGYSSLNLIKDIPWNVLKLDKSLVPEINGNSDLNEQNKVLFKYVIAMAQAMGLECIAEGVENREQVELLREYSCNLAQGFVFDKPMPKEEFEKKLSGYIYSI